LVSLGDATVAEQGAVLSELFHGFSRLGAGSSLLKPHGYIHASSEDELEKWTSARDGSAALLLVIYAVCEAGDAATRLVEGIVEMVSRLPQKIVLLVLHNPGGLLGLEASSREMASREMYHLQQFGAASQAETGWGRTLSFLAQPLDCLRDQCGWHFVLEIVRWSSDTTQDATEAFGAARAPMFPTINQLPFQLLLLVLRWSHFHPELVQICAKKLARQTQLIPQARVRRELAALQERQVRLWSGLYPSAHTAPGREPASKQENAASSLFLHASSRPQEVPETLVRLSKCRLWDTQKQFYKDQGIRAWSSGLIPFGVSSSSFLAAAYARIAVDFLLGNADCVKPSFRQDGPPNCFVWEAASGSCKFLHSFMLHFTELVEADDEFRRRGLVPLVVATDLSEQVLTSRRQMECFGPFIERRQLDFALFDTQEFVHGNSRLDGKRKALNLVHSRRHWQVGSDGPVALLGNYFLDSLRADVFTVAIQREATADDLATSCCEDEHVIVQAALLDKDTASITDMEITLRAITDPRADPFYEDNRLNATLVQVLDWFRSRAADSVEPGPSTGLVVFPVEAFEFLLTLLDRSSEAQAFPIALVAGDARFSFRDAISSAFVATAVTEEGSTEQVRLELPQLSPHPDCFCLPVDFELFALFFEQLNNGRMDLCASSELIAAPASDTFDVFFASVEPRSKRLVDSSTTAITKALQMSVRHQFARFTPGDCDLLWGMMSFDDGARCFSADALLALVAQTGWDFDLFVVLHWELLNRLRRQEADSRSEHYQSVLIQAGIKSWRTLYHMEQQAETDVTTRGIRLQLARWFYGELGAFIANYRSWYTHLCYFVQSWMPSTVCWKCCCRGRTRLKTTLAPVTLESCTFLG